MSNQRSLLFGIYSIYFLCGLALCFEGVFLPEFKIHFGLTYTEQMYTMFAKGLPFVIFSIPIGFFTRKIGFKNCMTIALILFAIGTWLLFRVSKQETMDWYLPHSSLLERVSTLSWLPETPCYLL